MGNTYRASGRTAYLRPPAFEDFIIGIGKLARNDEVVYIAMVGMVMEVSWYMSL
jgi:hypothetical protein